MFQLPSGLGSGGLLSYASQQTEGNTEAYVSGFQTALKLVSVAIGLTIGLGSHSYSLTRFRVGNARPVFSVCRRFCVWLLVFSVL